jgi:hypothetical protein
MHAYSELEIPTSAVPRLTATGLGIWGERGISCLYALPLSGIPIADLMRCLRRSASVRVKPR